jgi:DNA-binding IclR family transcriptional regulator
LAEESSEVLSRALDLLGQFETDRRRVTLIELADRTGLSKQAILRLTRTFVQHGFLRRLDDGSWELGAALARFGDRYRTQQDVGTVIEPALKRFAEANQETASYYVQDGNERVCTYRHNSPRQLRHHTEVGQRYPMDRGACGHVLRAFSGAKDAASEKIRQDGYCATFGERDPDVAGIAVPVRTFDGTVIGAIVLSGLVTRFRGETLDRYRASALAVGAEVSAALGWRPAQQGKADDRVASAKAVKRTPKEDIKS